MLENFKKALDSQIPNLPLTVGMFQSFILDYQKDKEEIARLKKRVEELEEFWLIGRKPPEKVPVPEKTIETKPIRKPRGFYLAADKMSPLQLEECKTGLFEKTYSLFRLTYPGIDTILKRVGGLRRYAFQNDKGRIWTGLNAFWREYEDWVAISKPASEYSGAIKRPQYKTLPNKD